MTDPLTKAARRLRIDRSCTDCLATSPLRYVGLSEDKGHHVFRCVTCDSTVLFGRVANDFTCNTADITPIAGGSRVEIRGEFHGGPSDPITDSEFPKDVA